jgi:SAM-dependent methyltransferase
MMGSERDSILSRMRQVYDEKILLHGCTAPAVGWNSIESQQMRFAQLLKVVDSSFAFSITDFGCGYGALADYLQRQRYSFKYCGFDISPQMIKKAKELCATASDVSFIERESELPTSDYTVASGIFNLQSETPVREWEAHILDTLATFNRLSQKGFAFNLLTSYSDKALMRPDLYYADPAFVFDYCKKNFSRFVSLLHDYPLYEFTILVFKNR